jgi:hypothetical protein
MAVDPDHLLVRDEGVDHGVLGGLHRGLVDLRCGLVGRVNEQHRDRETPHASAGPVVCDSCTIKYVSA